MSGGGYALNSNVGALVAHEWASNYAADFRILNNNFLVCDISAHVTATVGDVLVVPYIN
jgi:hypothetical protein